MLKHGFEGVLDVFVDGERENHLNDALQVGIDHTDSCWGGGGGGGGEVPLTSSSLPREQMKLISLSLSLSLSLSHTHTHTHILQSNLRSSVTALSFSPLTFTSLRCPSRKSLIIDWYSETELNLCVFECATNSVFLKLRLGNCSNKHGLVRSVTFDLCTHL